MTAITIIDYGVGNIASIGNMLKKVGHSAEFSSDPASIARASRLILPGVGAFDRAASRLSETGLGDLVRERATAGVPILGVCLGMQLLLDGSDEGELPGLGLIPGRSHRFPAEIDGVRLRVPHMGWNTVTRLEGSRDVLPRVESGDRFYFVHSYFVQPDSADHVVATTRHGVDFASMIRRQSVWGVQFHPEKSHRYGMRLLRDFAADAGAVEDDLAESLP